ncbi:hypothetical protein OAT68_02470 [Flavobacteriaceae bacterium]|nr:hypothetical protein [Flavobacteriaceae bacterium]
MAVVEAVIATLVTTPDILIVGVADIDLLKLAVIVTTLEPETKLSKSVSVKIANSEQFPHRGLLATANPEDTAKFDGSDAIADTHQPVKF